MRLTTVRGGPKHRKLLGKIAIGSRPERERAVRKTQRGAGPTITVGASEFTWEVEDDTVGTRNGGLRTLEGSRVSSG